MSGQKQVSTDISASPRTAVVVLGMYRSGASAFARVASLLGCDLPHSLMLANEGNRLGDWESSSIVTLNERILSSAGSKWDDWMPVNQKWSHSAVAPAFLAEVQDVLRADYGNSHLFVLQDPRICRLAPFWLKAIEGLGIRPVISFPLRNPYEVSSSLVESNGFDQGFGLLLWLRHVLEAEAATRHLSRHFFSFDQLRSDWTNVVDCFEQAASLRFPRRSVVPEAEISTFLKGDARHSSEANVMALNAVAPVWVRDAYTILQRWCAMDIQPDDFTRLDEIRAEFDAASPSFARFIAKGVSTSGGDGTEAQVRAELDQARSEVDRLKRDEVEAQKAQAVLTQGFEELNEANLRMNAEIASLSSALRQRQEEAAQAWKQAEIEQKLRQKAEAEQERIIKQNEELVAQFSIIDERVRADSRALASARRRAIEAEAAMVQLTRRHDKLLADLEAQGAELQRVMSRSARADSELAQLAVLLINVQGQVRELEEEAGNHARTLLEDRQSEALALKEVMAKQLAQVEAMNRQSKWLQEATIVLQKKPRLRALLSSKARQKYSRDLLKASGLFDPESYLEKNPDVAESGDDPLFHYVRHGLLEGRSW